MKISEDNNNKETKHKIKVIDEKLVTAIHNVNVKNYEKEIESLKTVSKSKGMSAAIYKLKEKVLGPKEKSPDAMGVEDPDSGHLITDPDSINEATLKYCLQLLSDRDPKPGYEKQYKEKLEMHNTRMLEKMDEDNEDLNYEQFEEALQIVSKKHSEKYKFILRAGNSLKNALFYLYSLIWKYEEIPDKWRESLLLQKLKNQTTIPFKI